MKGTSMTFTNREIARLSKCIEASPLLRMLHADRVAKLCEDGHTPEEATRLAIERMANHALRQEDRHDAMWSGLATAARNARMAVDDEWAEPAPPPMPDPLVTMANAITAMSNYARSAELDDPSLTTILRGPSEIRIDDTREPS